MKIKHTEAKLLSMKFTVLVVLLLLEAKRAEIKAVDMERTAIPESNA
jgi:hypothetical protein